MAAPGLPNRRGSTSTPAPSTSSASILKLEVSSSVDGLAELPSVEVHPNARRSTSKQKLAATQSGENLNAVPGYYLSSGGITSENSRSESEGRSSPITSSTNNSTTQGGTGVVNSVTSSNSSPIKIMNVVSPLHQQPHSLSKGKGTGKTSSNSNPVNNANPSSSVSDDEGQDHEDLEAQRFFGPLTSACFAGNVNRVRDLLESGANASMRTPLDKRTPLHFAAAGGSLEVCKLLVETYGAKSKPDRFGMLPIHEAEKNCEIRSYLYESECKDMEQPEVFQPPKRSGVMIPAMGNIDTLKSKVFHLCSRMSDFSYFIVAQEVDFFFNTLGLHPMYFAHFTASQIANHIAVLLSAKKVSKAAGSEDVTFALENVDKAFYLASLGPPDSQGNIYEQVSDYVLMKDRKTRAIFGKEASISSRGNQEEFLPAQVCSQPPGAAGGGVFGKYGNLENMVEPAGDELQGFSVMYMKSDQPAFRESKNRDNILRIFIVDRFTFDKRVAEDESDLQMVATPRFLRSKSEYALSRYQLLLDRVVSSKNAVITVRGGELYPGDGNGHVIQFGTYGHRRTLYMNEIAQCFNFLNMAPKRFYIESFANGVVTYTFFFQDTTEEEVQRAAQVMRFITHLKMTPGRSGLVWNCVLNGTLNPESMTYVISLVKFAHIMVPKERIYPAFLELRNQLSFHVESQTKFDELYKQALLEILTPERIYVTAVKHIKTIAVLFDDFKQIAQGMKKPFFNEKLFEEKCGMLQEDERLILRTMFLFNEALRCSNFFKKSGIPGAMAFRFEPSCLVRGREELYPEVPYGIYLIVGRDFFGWHVRFREIARGGIRCVKSATREIYTRNAAALFDETYNLAYTQQRKNKDIPEGGSKGTILLDSTSQDSAQDAFLKYIDSLLDIMQIKPGKNEKDGIFSHLPSVETLFFGPDENTADFMDLGAIRAKERGYPYAFALTTGKTQELGGVPHDLYGITTTGVHEYVLCLLKELNIDESSISKFQTGGPDGDLGSNEILISKDKTTAIVDGSGVAYDPNGLNRTELSRLAKARKPIVHFQKQFLSCEAAFVVSCADSNITLPDGSTWRNGTDLRNAFPLTRFAKADLFVPCGGRPAQVTLGNVKQLINIPDPETGVATTQWKYVVEGANLFFTDQARLVLESKGVILFKDASANKGGVTSSSLEVFAALALDQQTHQRHMTVQLGEPAPVLYTSYVAEIIAKIKENCQREFYCIWNATKSQQQGSTANKTTKTQLTAEVSTAINGLFDSLLEHMEENGKDKDLFSYVLKRAVPAILLEKAGGLSSLKRRVPAAYLKAMVAAWISSQFVYETGLENNKPWFFHSYMSQLQEAAANDAPSASSSNDGNSRLSSRNKNNLSAAQQYPGTPANNVGSPTLSVSDRGDTPLKGQPGGQQDNFFVTANKSLIIGLQHPKPGVGEHLYDGTPFAVVDPVREESVEEKEDAGTYAK
ncbi:unnamed protein product [Amoebophrya sp. A25]|nr:unnamed protein product [Amoebophrya sp. A25]|eukprot:GSA25T00001229001.1